MEYEKVGNKINRGIALLIYCDPGIGKTTLAATLPVDKTLIINTEAGLGPLLGTGHLVSNFNADNIDDLMKLYENLRTQKHQYKYVGLDNLSEYEQWLILALTKGRGKKYTELREYGDAAYKIRETLHLFRDLIYKGITVVFNAWEMPLEIRNIQGEVITKTFPKMNKRVAPEICGIVDVVGHLEVHTKTQQRWIRIGPSQQYITKTQFKGLDIGEEADLPALLDKIYAYDYSTEVKDGKT